MKASTVALLAVGARPLYFLWSTGIAFDEIPGSNRKTLQWCWSCRNYLQLLLKKRQMLMENKCHHLLVELLCKKHWNLSGARKIFCWSTQLPAFHSHQEERRMLSSRVGIHTMHTSWPHKCQIRRWMTHKSIFSSRPLNHTLGTNNTRTC